MNSLDEEEEAKLLPTEKIWCAWRGSDNFLILVIFTAVAYDFYADSSVSPVLPFLIHRHGFSNDTDSQELRSDYYETNMKVGLLWAVKPVAEVALGLGVGMVIDRLGQTIPLICGYVIGTAVFIAFAFIENYWVMLGLRALQGVSSCLTMVAGLSLLAERFARTKSLVRADCVALAGQSVGVIMGLSTSSTVFQFLGQKGLFLMLTSVGIIDIILRALLYTSKTPVRGETDEELELISNESGEKQPSVFKSRTLWIGLFLYSLPFYVWGLEWATEVTWARIKFNFEEWQIGTCLTIAAVFQLISQLTMGCMVHSFPEYGYALMGTGVLLCALSLVVWPLCAVVWTLAIPESLCRIGWSFVSMVTIPTVGRMVCSSSSESKSGVGFGLSVICAKSGMALGGAIGGLMVRFITFATLYRIHAVLLIIASALVVFLKKDKAEEEGTTSNGRQ